MGCKQYHGVDGNFVEFIVETGYLSELTFEGEGGVLSLRAFRVV